jgi:hypothetical protein
MNRILQALVFPAVLACFMACAPKPAEVPAGLLRQDEMVATLVDFHLAQARAQVRMQADNDTSAKRRYYGEALAKHGLAYPRFKASMDYYAAHPELLTGVYDRVIEELSKRQAEAAAGRHPAP